MSSIGHKRGFWAVRIVDGGYARRVYGRVGSVGDKWEEGVGNTNHDFHRGSFRNAPVGPPISWVPPGISLPPKSPPKSLRRAVLHCPRCERAWMGWSRGDGVLSFVVVRVCRSSLSASAVCRPLRLSFVVLGACHFVGVVRGEQARKKTKTSDDFHRGSFSSRT